MSFKKRSSNSLLFACATLCAILFVLPSCQGPAGVAGKDGMTTHDTLVLRDTLVLKDTLVLRDSLIITDSTYHIDTVLSKDTIFIKDTTVSKDTVVILDTTLMNPNCAVCHSSNQEMASKQYQWAETKHAVGESFIGEQGRRDCSRCHSGAAFRIFVDSGALTTSLAKIDSIKYLANGGTNVNCRTCHKIHTKYDTTDWKLTGPDSVQLIVSPTVFAKAGKGNLCATCHQSRSDAQTASYNLATAALPDDTINLTNSRIGPHYGPQLNMLLGIGGYEDIRYVTKPAAGTAGLHGTLVKDGCVTCHLGTKMSHTFAPELASCNTIGCHGNHALVPTALTGALNALPQQKTIDSLKAIVRDTLVAHGIAKLDTAANSTTKATSLTGLLIQAGTTAAPKKYLKKDVGLLINYVTVCNDKSRGVHNFKYTKFMLESALEGARH